MASPNNFLNRYSQFSYPMYPASMSMALNQPFGVPNGRYNPIYQPFSLPFMPSSNPFMMPPQPHLYKPDQYLKPISSIFSQSNPSQNVLFEGNNKI